MKEKFIHFYRGHKAGVWGAGAGLLIGVIILGLGFWKTVFLVFCALLGFVFGKIYVSDTPLGQSLRRIFRFREDRE